MPEWQINKYQELPSTQDAARESAKAGAAEGTVIVAERQSNGRGRNGNQWQTYEGNLLVSLILDPKEIAFAGQYSFIAAVTLNRTLCRLVPAYQQVKNKWPNDVLVNERKIAGILLEIADNRLIIGLGVNIAAAPDDKIFLNEIAINQVSPDEFLDRFLADLNDVLLAYQGGFEKIREEWLSRVAFLDQIITARLHQDTISGVFKGIDASGALQLRLANGQTKVIHSAEIFFGTENVARN